ncbi:hypothetical protein BGZ95_009519 [Linnemannia exigua]|uniref:Serine protease n=1 Tax=Linnemannia exigua TaxID=604196 RepID=A0AAD4H6K2_9FUNG|nr:hypothetical protein BGZ95_009519 [Linnemannia exigua]
MRFSTVILLSTAILLLSGSNTNSNNLASAQVSVPGRFRPHHSFSRYVVADTEEQQEEPMIPLYKPYLRSSSASQEQVQAQAQGRAQGPPTMSSMPVMQMPHMDNAQLLNDENNARAQLLATGGVDDGAYRFGKAVAMDSLQDGGSSTLSSGRWTHLKKQRSQYNNHDDDDNEEEDVMVWQLEIYSKSALSLNLIFSNFHLPPNSEFYIVSNGNGGTHLLGAFTAAVNNKPDRVFATAPVAGDRLLLEFYIPRSDFLQGTRPSLELSHVIHGYKPTLLAASSNLMSKGVRMADGSVVPRERRRPRQRQGGLREQQSFANPLSDWDQHSVSVTTNEDGDDNGPVRAMSGKCNIDVACHQNDYQDQSRSVGAILSEYNQKYCSGALINNARQDGRQLFLTANHCTGFADTSAHLIMFNHEKIQCGSSPEEVNEHDTAMGLIKLGSYADSDYTLYEIVENIPDAYNLYLSGWSALATPPASRLRNPGPEQPDEPEVLEPNEPEKPEDEDDGGSRSPWRTVRHKRPYKKDPKPTPTPTPTPPEDPSLTKLPVFGIHHPSGDSKKISFFYNGSLPRACWSECQAGEMLHWQIPRWDRGTTEPGSSGSPLFDADKRIVGQLHGGSASCWNRNGYDVYGAVHASFLTPPKIKDRLATYLDPEGTGVKVLDGYTLEQARRESRQRHQSHRVEGEEIVEFEPLGRPGLEKPLNMNDEDESHLDNPSHGRYRHRHPHHRHRPNNVARLSRAMNKLWQELVQSYSGNNNNDDIDNMAASPVIFEEDQLPCDQFRK